MPGLLVSRLGTSRFRRKVRLGLILDKCTVYAFAAAYVSEGSLYAGIKKAVDAVSTEQLKRLASPAAFDTGAERHRLAIYSCPDDMRRHDSMDEDVLHPRSL